MACAHQVLAQVLARADQITKLLLTGARHPHEGELAGGQKPGQPVGARESVLTRSVGFLGTSPGAQTRTSIPAAAARRASP
jgi:hypothetical protein